MRMLERSARVLALALLAWLAWSALRPVARTHSIAADLGRASRDLPAWVRDAELSSVHVTMDSTPSPAVLAVLGALGRAGTDVGWGGPVPPLGIAAAPVADPVRPTRISVAGSRDAALRVADPLGVVDSLRTAATGAELVANQLESPTRASVGRFSAMANIVDSLILRPVLVIGSAGWEAKFVVAALEERGWRVATQLAVGPAVHVTQGNALPIDTARYSAVVVLDTSAALWAEAISRYARSGGGVVLAGRAVTIPALVSLSAATLGVHRAARPALVADSVGLRSLARWTLASLRTNATPLTRYDAELAVAARVVGAGRVVQVGSEESWRWRMEGAGGSADAHREWWSHLVAAVAYAPSVMRVDLPATVAAPRAQIIDALGAPRPALSAAHAFDPLHSPVVLSLLFALLLLEWASRRLRGAR